MPRNFGYARGAVVLGLACFVTGAQTIAAQVRDSAATDSAKHAWIMVTAATGVAVAVDTHNLVRRGNLLTVAVRDQFQQPLKLANGTPFNRTDARVRFNCAARTYHVESVTWFMRNAAVSQSENRENGEQHPRPATVWDRLTSFVCKP